MTESNSAIRIVIADDHTIFRDGLRRLLEAEGNVSVVGEAADGEAAVRLVEQLRPDILLLDLVMPRTPGLEALRQLQGDSAAPRIVLLTAAIEQRQIVEALQCGARGVVMKDAATEMLMQAIQSVMHGDCWVGREVVSDMPRYLKKMTSARPFSRARAFSLTRRETEVLAAIVEGLTNREIAAKFALSEDTVKHHLTSIFDKLDVTNRLELAMFAINNRLLED